MPLVLSEQDMLNEGFIGGGSSGTDSMHAGRHGSAYYTARIIWTGVRTGPFVMPSRNLIREQLAA